MPLNIYIKKENRLFLFHFFICCFQKTVSQNGLAQVLEKIDYYSTVIYVFSRSLVYPFIHLAIQEIMSTSMSLVSYCKVTTSVNPGRSFFLVLFSFVCSYF